MFQKSSHGQHPLQELTRPDTHVVVKKKIM